MAHYLRQEAGSDITDVDKPILAVPALAVPAIIEPNPSDAAPDTGAADIASDTIAEIELITASELLDVNYYLINYPGVRECDLSPAEHFCRYGWREGRRPNPYFDPAWYLKTYFLIPDDSVNPLVHYIKFGEAAGYKPIIYFDPEWYREKYRINTDGHLLAHFLKNRRRQKYSPISFFDVEWYLERHRAEIGANRDPFAHYLRVGISKDIDPGPDFDAKRYRLTAMGQTAPPPNPIAGAEIHEKLNREIFNPLVHYLLKKARAPLRDAQAPSIRNLLNKLLPSSLTR
ncbi:MAG: hypothetical protein PHT60_14470 [Acidiphilium sp.]|nr:hypothetical protein [Acidiphilium sp.]MDD4936966.1 hypothetical protein [Acidiphilium sp.]